MDQSEIGAQVRATAQSAQQAAAAAQSEGCKVCKRLGLPILPLRYAVVPKGKRKGTGPALHSTLGAGVKDVALPADTHEYVIRTLREGYVYVLLDKKIWQAYEVTEHGHLRQFNPFNLPKAPPEPLVARCRDEGHDIPGAFLNIDTKRYKSALVAFAHDAWTKTVLDEYKSGKRPSDRFLKLDLTKLQTTPDAIEHAFEIDKSLKRLTTGVEEFVKEAKDFGSVHGFHPLHERTAKYAKYVDKQKASNPKAKVAAIVLMDPVGMVQELNAARLTIVEQCQAYSSRFDILRKQQVSNSIIGLKEIIKQNALAARASEPDIMQHKKQTRHGARTYTSTREERATNDFNKTWKEMNPEGFYNEPARKIFADDHEKKLKAYQASLAKFDQDYVTWAERQDWIKIFQDYDSTDTRSCLALTCMAAPCLSGGIAAQKSFDLWKKWLSTSPTDASNPVYRALFGDRKQLLQYLTPQGGDLNKADELYDTVKGLAESDEVKKHIKEPVLAAVAHIQLALGGAASMLGEKLGRTAETVVLRTQQATIHLYTKLEVTFLRVTMTVGEYYKLLSEAAFNTPSGKVTPGLVNEGGRKVKSLVLGGVLSISNPKVRDTVIEVIIWSIDRAEAVQRELKALSRNTKELSAAVLRRIRLHTITLGGNTAKTLGQLQGIALDSKQVAAFAKNHVAKTLRAAGSLGIVLSAGSVFFQGWSFQNSMKEVETKLGKDKDEAMASLGSAGFGVIGGSIVVVGEAMKNIARKGTTLYSRAIALLKVGGVFAAIASAFDGVQSFLASGRTWHKGDNDAAGLYLLSGAAFAAGAFFAGKAALAVSASLLGPFGIALALIAIGVLLAWAALNAEDTQMQIWLDRCVFGNGKRSEGRWKDHEFADEMAELNAIILGLKAELAWEDNWGFDGFKSRITFPGFDGNLSAYEYSILAKDNKGGWHSVIIERYGLNTIGYDSASAQNATHLFKISKPEFKKEGSNLIVQHDFLLDDNVFTEAQVEVRYQPNKTDTQAEAKLKLLQKDFAF